MRDTKEFIERVSNKMGYSKEQYSVIEDSNVYDDLKDDIEYALDKGMVFIEGTCIPKSSANLVVSDLNESTNIKVITFDKFGGISILIKYSCESSNDINIQGLGSINSFLNQLLSTPKEESEPIEKISLKEYYKLNFPNKRIGRKSDETLIKELQEAGFEV